MKKEIHYVNNNLKAVDFFCGAGGVTCGFSQIGINVLGGIDIDSKFKDTYEKNSGAKFIKKDVSELSLTPKKLEKLIPIKENDDSLIFVGCSPCQYFSNLNSDKTKSKKGRLLLDDFKEFVLAYKPGFVFIENVPGLEKKIGSPLYNFKKELRRKGYVFDQNVLNAKYFGVAQNRRRFVLIATRLLPEIKLPLQKKDKITTVRKAIGDYKIFPEVEHGYKDSSSFQHSVAKLSDLNLKRVQKVSKDGGNRKDFENDDKLQLECYKNHDGHYDVYGRLAWNKPSPTITTRFIYTSTGRYSHPEQDRAISLREGATLQSFPLNYKFYSSSQGAIATMIGNAVPPKLAEAIGVSIQNHWNQWLHLKQKPVQ